MEMPGGGPLNTQPGQVTDDGELSMCSLFALVQTNIGRKKDDYFLDTDVHAKIYKQWWLSRPFDFGESTENGFQVLVDDPTLKASKTASE